jgi:predicted DNA-binding protein
MPIQLTPEHEARIKELARQTGRDNTEVLSEVIDSYFEELGRINAILDRRYDAIKSGEVRPSRGDEVFERLRRKSEGRRAAHE